MCLNLDQPEKRIAEKEIKVLKVLGRDKNNKLVSPIFDETWKSGEEKQTDLTIIIDKFEYPREAYRTTFGYYSFSNILSPDECKGRIVSCKANLSLTFEVWEAIIPIGSEYIKKGNQFCSNKLKLIKRVL
jgi:hypothetical protein